MSCVELLVVFFGYHVDSWYIFVFNRKVVPALNTLSSYDPVSVILGQSRSGHLIYFYIEYVLYYRFIIMKLLCVIKIIQM